MDENGYFDGRERGLRVPEVETQFRVGNTTIYVFDVEDNAYDDSQGRTVVTGHDDEGNEVEIRFFPADSDNEDN